VPLRGGMPKISGDWWSEGTGVVRSGCGDVGRLGRGAGWVQQRRGLLEAVEMVKLARASTT